MKREPVNPHLYALCREGTDPAITRALEEARDPMKKLARRIREEVNWDVTSDSYDELRDKLQAVEMTEA